MTPLELAALKAAAEAATPGPWKECGAQQDGCQCCLVWALAADEIVAAPRIQITAGAHRERCELGEGFTVAQGKKNATFIALANPAVVLGLLAELEGLRKAALPICPHCLETVSEDVGVEGPKGNLWHDGCLTSWQSED